jgi:hypothetical protein
MIPDVVERSKLEVAAELLKELVAAWLAGDSRSAEVDCPISIEGYDYEYTLEGDELADLMLSAIKTDDQLDVTDLEVE